MKNNDIQLTLRQRQILNHLQQAENYVTGVDLSNLLQVSSRTIRNDVATINLVLESSHIQIVSKHSFGYKLEASNQKDLQKIIRISQSFISKAERVRYIALQLCIQEKPMNVYDLSDEMFISKTTLDHDLIEVKNLFLNPFEVQFYSNKNFIYIENDERKKRKILLQLYSQDWNYNGKTSTFYSYEYIHETIVNECRMKIHYILDTHDISIEDVNLIHLILMISIAYQRICDGHQLQDARNTYYNETGKNIIDIILSELEQQWNCSFNSNERLELYEMLSCSLLPKMEEIYQKGISNIFSPDIIRFTNQYLKFIETKYHLNVFDDEDFYNTITCFFQYLSLPVHYLNYNNVSQYISHQNLIIEFEIAYEIQPFAKDFYKRPFNYIELIYLSLILSAVLNTLTHKRINAVILSHLNMPATWNLRKQIEERFSTSIFVTNLLPIYQKDKFDFKNTDLVFTTTKINYLENAKKIINVNPSLNSSNVQEINEYLHSLKYEFMYQNRQKKTIDYLKEAIWYENMQESNYIRLIKKMVSKNIQEGLIDQSFLEDILQREQIISFATRPVYSIVYSSIPAKQTKIEVVTLKHRVKINDKKIRMIIFLYTAKEDQSLKFLFLRDFFENHFDANESRFLKTKDEFMNYFQKIFVL